MTAVILFSLPAGCTGSGEGAPADRAEAESVAETAEVVELSEPRVEGPVSLEEAVAARRSIRSYDGTPLQAAEVSQLLWAAQGVTEAGSRGRAAPSAGGTYPLELYLVTADGLARYLPAEHRLALLGGGDLRPELAAATGGQQWVADAAVVVVIAAVFERTAGRYGERAERYVYLEAGHAAQNLLLQATALGLGAVPVGAFRDAEVADLLSLPGDHVPVYLIAVGRPGG
jgi:SagB-type dehydrogenase family enzyme